MLCKKLSVIVTFPNTTSALAMEDMCKKNGIPGEIVPVPDAITAGCGFAWKADVSCHEAIKTFVEENNLKYSEFYELEI
ncbi:MAG: DUF3343 domain-containing protein [Dehalococcoidales bacterium]|jgi:hypothetical protein|nr:DUF3343 domain-containing protein [Dehalococcoidales bacterium]